MLARSAIHFICPHCGAETDVGEQFAGQTGPCASCEKSVAIPKFAGGNASRHRGEEKGGGGIVVIVAIVFVLGILLCGAGALLFLGFSSTPVSIY